jgi:hypothetical protein
MHTKKRIGEGRAKMMCQFTTDELRTLCVMCQNEAAHIAVRELDKHKNLKENATYQRILSISKKAYAELIARSNAE